VANIQNRYGDEHYRKYHYGEKEYNNDDDYYSRRKHKKGDLLQIYLILTKNLSQNYPPVSNNATT